MSNTKKIKVKKKKVEEKPDELTLLIREALNTTGRRATIQQEKMLVSVFRLLIIGGISTVIDFVLYFILYHFVKINPLLANSISFLICTIYGLWASFQYSFSKGHLKQDLIFFLVLALLGFILTEGVIYLFIYPISLSPILPKFLSIILVIIMKHFIKKFWNSKKK